MNEKRCGTTCDYGGFIMVFEVRSAGSRFFLSFVFATAQDFCVLVPTTTGKPSPYDSVQQSGPDWRMSSSYVPSWLLNQGVFLVSFRGRGRQCYGFDGLFLFSFSFCLYIDYTHY